MFLRVKTTFTGGRLYLTYLNQHRWFSSPTKQPLSSLPVITILTKNPTSTNKIQNFLQQLFNLKPIDMNTNIPHNPNENETYENETFIPSSYKIRNESVKEDEQDLLNCMFHPITNLTWKSNASICLKSNVLFHFLSLSSNSIQEETNDISDHDEMYLLSITSSSNKDQSCNVHYNNGSSYLNVKEAIKDCRKKLAKHINLSNYDSIENKSYTSIHQPPYFLGLKLMLLYSLRKNITPSHLFGISYNSPILDLPDLDGNNTDIHHETTDKPFLEQVNNDNGTLSSCCLREIVIPYRTHRQTFALPEIPSFLSYFSSTNPSTSLSGKYTNIMEQLLNSSLLRPKTGLFQWPTVSSSSSISAINSIPGLIIRPIPASDEDMRLPPPSLIFQTDSLQSSEETICKVGGTASMIGFNGVQNSNNRNSSFRQGQIRVTGLSVLNGFDIRYCESKVLSSTFSESHESLLAGSIDELQSVNVMVEGQNQKFSQNVPVGEKNKTGLEAWAGRNKTDMMNGIGDCWVEFRANMKRPTSFFRERAK